MIAGWLVLLLAADPAADFNAGLAAQARGEGVAASALYQRAQAEAPGWALPGFQLAELLLEAGGQPARALTLLEPLVRAEPKNPRGHHLQALALAEQGDPAGAEAAERVALGLRPEYRAAEETLASALWSQHKVDQALAEWSGLAQRHPEDTALRAQLVDRLLDAGRPVDAEKELRLLAVDQPQSPVWHRRLARTLDLEGLTADAETERALALKLSGVTPPRRKLRRLPDSKR